MSNRQAYNPVGGIITTNSSEFQVIDTAKYGTEYSSDNRNIYNLVFKNIGTTEIFFKVNQGEKMPLGVGKSFSCGDYKVISLLIYNKAAKIQFSGFISEPYKEV